MRPDPDARDRPIDVSRGEAGATSDGALHEPGAGAADGAGSWEPDADFWPGQPVPGPAPERGAGAWLRGSRVLLLFLAGMVVLAAAAGVAVGRNFLSPAQRAADAAPPVPSLITVPVRLGRLAARVVVHATVTAADPVLVRIPADLGSDLPVVTSVATGAGAQIQNGQELLSVAERPVFVFSGTIPAFRDMRPDTSGVDVAEVQEGLREAGYATGNDPLGSYGPGTAAAVQALYLANRAEPTWSSPTAQADLARLRAAVAAASPGRAAAKAERALVAAQQTEGVILPLGDAVFVPRLPQPVLSLSVRPGSVAKASRPLAAIGSGRVQISGVVNQQDRSQLRVGMRASAGPETSGASFRMRISAIAAAPSGSVDGTDAPGYRVAFMPSGPLPGGIVGKSIAITAGTRSTGPQVLIVPVASISTGASGRTYVTVATAAGRERDVTVRLGLSTGGEQAVSPVGGALKPGESVVIGSAAAGSG
jgi:hypothetical protein